MNSFEHRLRDSPDLGVPSANMVCAALSLLPSRLVTQLKIENQLSCTQRHTKRSILATAQKENFIS